MVSISVSASATFDRFALLANRSIFLHFINRELLAVRGLPFNEKNQILSIKCCGLMTNGIILAPFAQVSELFWKSKKANDLIAQLCSVDKIHLCNKSTDVYTFLESRKDLYAAQNSRYPMYFGKKPLVHKLTTSPALDTTSFIKTTILKAMVEPEGGSNLFTQKDLRRLEKNSDYLLKEFREGPLAATFSMYEHTRIAPKPDEVRFIGDISSRLFAFHYAERLDLITPTGFFQDTSIEDFDYFPLFDLKLNNALFDKLGLMPIIFDTDFHQPYINFITDEHFDSFCRTKLIFIQALAASAGRGIGAEPFQNYAILPYLQQLDFGSSCRSHFQRPDVLMERIVSVMRLVSTTNRNFAEAIEVIMVRAQEVENVIVFTATEVENENFRSSIAVKGYKFVEVRTFVGMSAAVYKNGGGLYVWEVRTSAGSAGVHGSARVSAIAIEHIKPSFVFSVGIGFGVDDKSQRLGDVLVSEYVMSYERVKIHDNEWQWRGDKVPTSHEGVSFGRHYDSLSSDFGVIVGGILSGDKLVDDRNFRDALTKLDPKAVGGEMEAAGLIQSCQVSGVRFTMIKGICDFAVGKNDKAQALAAKNAFSVAFDMIAAFERAGALAKS